MYSENKNLSLSFILRKNTTLKYFWLEFDCFFFVLKFFSND